MIEPVAALEARLADARLRIDRDEDRLAQLEAALEKARFWIAQDTDALEAGHKPYDLDNPLDVEIAQEVDDRRTWLTRATTETPAEPITVLRECWNCGHDHDADQDIKFCHSCGAANPNSVGPQSNRRGKPNVHD